jgi:hypothetical protein
MQPTRVRRSFLIEVLIVFVGSFSFPPLSQGQQESVSIFIVRHAETDSSQPTLPLSARSRERAELLAPTVSGVTFTHLFSTHTTRARQMLEGIASKHGLPIVQLPQPGSTLDGELVTDRTTRRAPIEPVAAALLKLPPGSVALAALNSGNIYAILNRLGVPVADAGTPCVIGRMCVPCLDNKCFPPEFDRLWHVVLEPGRTTPIAFVELRYGVGWRPSER